MQNLFARKTVFFTLCSLLGAPMALLGQSTPPPLAVIPEPQPGPLWHGVELPSLVYAGVWRDAFLAAHQEGWQHSLTGTDWSFSPWPDGWTMQDATMSDGTPLFALQKDWSQGSPGWCGTIVSGQLILADGSGTIVDFTPHHAYRLFAATEIGELTEIELPHGGQLASLEKLDGFLARWKDEAGVWQYSRYQTATGWQDLPGRPDPIRPVLDHEKANRNTATGLGMTLTLSLITNPPPSQIPHTTEIIQVLPNQERAILSRVNGYYQHVLFGNGVFVLAGFGKYLVSPDGIEWTASEFTASRGPYSYFYFSQGAFHLYSYHRNPTSVTPSIHHAWSVDGLHWEEERGVPLAYVTHVAQSGQTAIEGQFTLGENVTHLVSTIDGVQASEGAWQGMIRSLDAGRQGFALLDGSGKLWIRPLAADYLPPVAEVRFDYSADDQSVDLSWPEVIGAARYRIFRQSKDNRTKWDLLGETSHPAFRDDRLPPAQIFYRLRADQFIPPHGNIAYRLQAVDAFGVTGWPTPSLQFARPVEIVDLQVEMAGVFGEIDVLETDATVGVLIAQGTISNEIPPANAISSNALSINASNRIYGGFHANFFPWTFTSSLGWVYNVGVREALPGTAVWLYKPSVDWLYASQTWYPFLYAAGEKTWYWIDTNNGTWYRRDVNGGWQLATLDDMP